MRNRKVLRAVQPNGSIIRNLDGKSFVLNINFSLYPFTKIQKETYGWARFAGNKARKDAAIGRFARSIELGFDYGMVFWKKLKDDFLAWFRLDCIRGESKSVLANSNRLNRCTRGSGPRWSSSRCSTICEGILGEG